MPFKKRPAAAPKKTIYDDMDDAKFVEHLEGLLSIEKGAEAAAIERRVQKTQGTFYERASRLFLQKTSDREVRGTDTSF